MTKVKDNANVKTEKKCPIIYRENMTENNSSMENRKIVHLSYKVKILEETISISINLKKSKNNNIKRYETRVVTIFIDGKVIKTNGAALNIEEYMKNVSNWNIPNILTAIIKINELLNKSCLKNINKYKKVIIRFTKGNNTIGSRAVQVNSI